MNELSEIVISEINSKGRITFQRFMELALYNESHGYYSSGNMSIGRGGDFYTSPYVNKVFGELIAGFIIKSLGHINSSRPVIVEIGGGKGTLAKDILDTIERKDPDAYKKLIYKYIERGPKLNDQAQSILKNHLCKVEFIDSITKIIDADIEGVVISNELFDSIPFHRLTIINSVIKECYVSYKDNEFIEVKDLPSNDELITYITEFGLDLAEEQEFEINIGARNTLSEISRILKKGIVLTIDYGYLAQELYSRSRLKGTYKCMKDHTMNENPYRDIGMQDITAHVNFSDLIKRGDELGLREIKYTTQGQFLVDFGILDIIENISKEDGEESGKSIATTKNLFLPGSMGNKFKVLIQQKNLENEAKDFYPESPLKISFDIV